MRKRNQEPPPLRILVCSGNMGNAPPDPDSIAAWLPEDGRVRQVVEGSKHPLPSAKEQMEFYQEIGLEGATVYDRATSDSRRGDALSSIGESEEDDSVSQESYFDVIVLGLQEATFKVETMEKEMSQSVLPLLSPVLRKVNKQVSKAAEKGTATFTQFTADKNHLNSRREIDKHSTAFKQQNSNVTDTERSNLDSTSTLNTDSSNRPMSLHMLAAQDSAVLEELLAQRLPSYDFVIRHQRGEMRLEVLVREGVTCDVVSVKAQNTGLVNLGANKGGIVGELWCNGTTRISFCTAHLEAHEGHTKYKHRCNMISQILDGTADESLAVKYDVSQKSHFTFVLGDLNFRTDMLEFSHPTGNGADASKDHLKKEHHGAVMKLVESKQWPELNQHDELFRGLKDKDLLVGFDTLPCFFPPTFKMERQAGYKYKEQRRPSYCDRILWKCAQDLETSLTPLTYEPIDDFCTSDHKPVRAAFEIKPNEKINRRPSMMRRGSVLDMFRQKSVSGAPVVRENLHLYVSNIKCVIDKKTSKFDVDPHPYVAFVSSPKGLVRRQRSKWQKTIMKLGIVGLKTSEKSDGQIRRTVGGWPRTKKLDGTYTPDWAEEQVHIVVKTHGKDGEVLDHSGSLLHLTVIDHNPSVELSRQVGTFTLNLAHLSQNARQKGPAVASGRRASMMWSAKSASSETLLVEIQDHPLVKHGTQRGTISCTIDACWVDNATDNSRKSVRNLKKKNVLRRLKIR